MCEIIRKLKTKMTTNGERAGNEDVRDDYLDAIVQLKDELRRRKLRTSGVKTMLVEQLRAAILLDSQKDDEADQDDGDRDNAITSDESEDDGGNNRRQRDDGARSNRMCVLTFKDVEDSIDTFSGDDGTNVIQWIQNFEETASLCQWNEVQKMVYVKKLLRGSARLFIKYEERGKMWKEVKVLSENFPRQSRVHDSSQSTQVASETEEEE